MNVQHFMRLSAASLLLMATTAARADSFVDPMRPASATSAPVAATPKGAMRLEAIIHDGERRLAIIDGKIVREGDRLGACVIDAILPNAVRFTKAGHAELIALPTAKLPVRRTAALVKEPS